MNKTTKSKPAARAAAPRNYVPRDVPAKAVPVPVQREPEVIAQIGYMDASLSDLEQSIVILADRLQPISTPHGVSGETKGSEPSAAISPVADMLDTLNRRLWAARSAIDQLRECLEV